MGQALWLPGLLGRKAGYGGVGRTWQRLGSRHLLGRHQAGRRGHVGKTRPGEPEGPPVGALVLPLVHCIALGKRFDLSGLQTKKKKKKTKKKKITILCISGELNGIMFVTVPAPQ